MERVRNMNYTLRLLRIIIMIHNFIETNKLYRVLFLNFKYFNYYKINNRFLSGVSF